MLNCKFFKRTAAFVCIFALLFTMSTGCAKKADPAQAQAGSSQTGDKQANSKPLDISFMCVSNWSEIPQIEGPGLDFIEKYTNTKLTINWTNVTGYDEKLLTSIASNDLPDVVVVNNPIEKPGVVSAIRSGLFWEIEPYLKGLKNFNDPKLRLPQVVDNSRIDGKLYGVYGERALTRDGIIYRKDWLEKLGLKDPKTSDDVMNMIKAFALNDPDKNGKNDTYGLTTEAGTVTEEGLRGFQTVLLWNGGFNGWGDQGGKLVPAFMTKEWTDTQKQFRSMYKDKLMNMDFPIIKRQQAYDYMMKGTAGIIFATISDAENIWASLPKVVPDAKLDLGLTIQGPKGIRTKGLLGFNDVRMFPKTSVKNEEKLKGILAFFDKLLEDEAANFFELGIKDRHYTQIDSKYVNQTKEQYDLRQKEIRFGNIRLRYFPPLMSKTDVEIMQKVKNPDTYIQGYQYAVKNPAINLISDTYVEKGPELAKIIFDAHIKYVIGEMDDSGWDKAVDQWRKQGGDKVMDEYTKLYLKNKK